MLRRQSSRWLKAGFAVLALAGIGIAAYAWRGTGGDAAAGFRTASVDRGDIRVVVAATGNLAAVSTVDIGSQVSGQIVDVQGDFNDRVRANDVIATIDPHPFEARVTQAQADLDSAEAQRASARASANEARVVAANAKRTLERTVEIRKRGLVSQADLDAAQLAADQAGARIAVAEAGETSAAASVAQRRAALDNAAFDLERAVIRAPVDGVIVMRAVERGQTVAASFQTPVLFQIAEDLTQMQIVLAIDEADIGQVKAGQPARFTVDAFPGRQFAGAVSEVRLSATNTSNVITYPVVVAVDNADLALLPGMTANAEIEISTKSAVLRVPNAALRYKPASEVPRGGGMPGGSQPTEREQRAMAQRLAAARAAMQRELATRLSLDPAQQAALAEAMSHGRGDGGASGALPAGGDGARSGGARRAAMIERTLKAIEPSLRPDQLVVLAAYRDELRDLRAAELYVPGASGPEPRNVRIGITDGQYTELAAGAVREGDAVITGVAGPQG